MGYYDEKKDINNLISVDANGISVPTFVQIRDALIQNYKMLYGSDIDLDTVTADGQYVHNEANMINNIMIALNKIQSQMNPNTATGTMLDTLCAFSGVTRQEATKSYVDMCVKYIGRDLGDFGFASNLASGSDNVQKIVAVDKNGKTWTWSESKIDNVAFNTQFVKNQIYYLRFECDEFGPNAAEAGTIEFDENNQPILTDENHGYIYQTVDSTLYPFSIWQKSDAILGQNRESDQSLRNRRLASRSDNGVSTLSGLKGSLENIGGVKEVKIFNNNSNDPDSSTPKDGTTIPAHNVYVCVRYEDSNILNKESIDSLDSTIGTTIYNKLTPGIPTCPTANLNEIINRLYTYTLTDSTPSAQIYWKLCYPIYFYKIVLSFMKLTSYEASICETEIEQNCKAYANTLSISDDLIIYNLLGYLNNNTKPLNNRSPYYFTSGYIVANEPASGQPEVQDVQLINSDNYFDLAKQLIFPAPLPTWVPILDLDKSQTNANYPDMIVFNSPIDSAPKLKLRYKITNASTIQQYWPGVITAQGFNGGSNINQDLEGSISNGDIVYYSGANVEKTYSHPHPKGGVMTDSVSLKSNTYYYVYRYTWGDTSAIGYSETHTAFVEVPRIIDAYITDPDFESHAKAITNINQITDPSATGYHEEFLNSIADRESGKYLFNEQGGFVPGAEKIRFEQYSYKFTYSESDSNATLTIQVKKTNS